MSTILYIPPPRPHLISRPRLIRRLNRGLHLGYPLTLLATPAGFGKIMLLGQAMSAALHNWRDADDFIQTVYPRLSTSIKATSDRSRAR